MKTITALFTFLFSTVVAVILVVAVIIAAIVMLFKSDRSPRRRQNETLDQRIERLWEALSDDAKDQVRSLKQAHAGGFLSDQDMKTDIEKILNAVDIPV